jgi:hypothetical protein
MLAHQEDRPQPTRNASQNVSSERLRLTEEEVDALIENFAKEDDLTRKTWTRRVVENFLMKVRVEHSNKINRIDRLCLEMIFGSLLCVLFDSHSTSGTSPAAISRVLLR